VLKRSSPGAVKLQSIVTMAAMIAVMVTPTMDERTTKVSMDIVAIPTVRAATIGSFWAF
jgi:hypothetical protein